MKPLKSILLIVCSMLALGQTPEEFGSITGTVQDESRAPLPGATVVASGPAGTFRVMTDAHGFYALSQLPLGTYRLSADLPGFRENLQTNVGVEQGAPTRREFVLALQAARPAVVAVQAPRRERGYEITSDRQSAQGVVVLYRGNVRMVTDGMELRADELDFNTTTLAADARGNVRVRVLPVTVRPIPLSSR